jgi:murein DD-endopeptidase MepM/ murein hydrolase activator NlpD
MEGIIMRRIVVIVLFIISTLLSFAQQQQNERFAHVINRLVEAMNKQDYAGIVREYDSGMSSRFSLDLTTILFKNYESQYGKVNKVDPPQVKSSDQAVYVLYFERGVQDLTLYIDGQEKIKGFVFTTHVFPESQPTQEPKSVPVPVSTQAANPVPSIEQKTTPKTTTPTVEPKPAQTQLPAKTTTPAVDLKLVQNQPPTKTTSSTAIIEQKPTPIQASTKTTAQTPTVEPKVVQPKTPLPVIASTTISDPVAKQSPAVVIPADKQQTELNPPFKGAWTVVTGGELREGAAQRNLLQQQFAYEFSAKDSNGLRYKNDGKANEDYYGYGKEVTAPANGTVVEAIDGIRENSPGLRNPYAPVGNAIIIQHSNREYSVLAFLKQGSIRVKAGDKITRGQVIAQCGISGNATEPVIHYHLQDSPYLQTAKGIKFYFDRAIVTKEGKKELNLIHLPEVGETISPE